MPPTASAGCTALRWLGANDGIVSTASLIVGVAATGSATQQTLLVMWLSRDWSAGAASMAAGEYVSVSATSR